MEKLKMHSPNLVDANIEKLAALFPNCVTEVKTTESTEGHGKKNSVNSVPSVVKKQSTLICCGRNFPQSLWKARRSAITSIGPESAKPC
jgi:hypothetical protein